MKKNDDLDDLLNDLDDIMKNPNQNNHYSFQKSSLPQTYKQNQQSQKDQLVNNIEDLINQPQEKQTSNLAVSPMMKKQRKCNDPFIGPPLGYELKKPCDKLRCTKCDLKVNIFNGQKWKQTCEYMFFRNNFNNLQVLREQLLFDSSSIAYNCQCQWYSVSQKIDLRGKTWVCAGHES